MGKWVAGFPPDCNTDKWEVYFSPIGEVWHRAKMLEANSTNIGRSA